MTPRSTVLRSRALRSATVVAAPALALAVLATAPAASAAATTAAATAAASVTSGLPTSTTTVWVSVDGRSFSARLVQPTGSAPGAYPVVAFGHGFLQSARRYDPTLTAIASLGYVVIAPDSETGLFPSHSRFADDLTRSIAWVRATQPNADARLDAVAGHSMGGGAALIAADRHPEVESVATLAAAQTSPSATGASAGIASPALYVVGSQDGIVAPSTTRTMYAAKPSPAAWASITGGYHCGFQGSSSFFGLGCDSGSISRTAQLTLTGTLVGSWFDQTLKGAAPAPTPAGVVAESK